MQFKDGLVGELSDAHIPVFGMEFVLNKEQSMVLDFHKRFSVKIQTSPRLLDEKTTKLRHDLIAEELDEFRVAAHERNLVKVADAIADMLYVVYGTAVSYGIDIEPVFAEVHHSNMSKSDPEVIRAPNGKVLKGANWSPPNIEEKLR